MADEVEIKFRIRDLALLRERLRALGFHEKTARTHEFNTIYDDAQSSLRGRGELLRLRQYGEKWTLTHKGVSDSTAKHKTRAETETMVEDGEAMRGIMQALGYAPRFVYEKYRTEFADARDRGHVVLDETPIGNFAEIEGPASWIDETASRLGVLPSEYITQSYAGLFVKWRKSAGSDADNMTWVEVGTRRP